MLAVYPRTIGLHSASAELAREYFADVAAFEERAARRP
jgi:hypothetical protein